MSNIGEVGNTLSGIMRTVQEANQEATLNEAERQHRGAAVESIRNSLRSIMEAAGALGIQYSEDAASIATSRTRVFDASVRLRDVDISPAASSRAVGLLAATEGSTVYQSTGRIECMLGAHTSLNTLGLTLSHLAENLAPLVEVMDDGVRHVNNIPRALEASERNSVAACEVITDYATQARIPVHNPYSP